MPALLGCVMFALTQQVYTLIFAAFMPLMVLAGYAGQIHAERIRHKRALKRFRRELAALHKTVVQTHVAIRGALSARHPGCETAAQMVLLHKPELWCRRPEQEDFLTLRLGSGKISSPLEITQQRENSAADLLSRELQQARENLAQIEDAPLTIDLKTAGHIAVVGPDAEAATRALLIQFCVLHSPTEVQVAALLPPEHAARWEWLKWLPHTWRGTRGKGSGNLLCTLADGEQGRRANEFLADLEKLAAKQIGKDAGERAASQRLVLLVPYPSVLLRRRLHGLAKKFAAAGIHLLYLVKNTAEMPGCCRGYLDTENSTVGQLGNPDSITQADYEKADIAQALHLARVLAQTEETDAEYQQSSSDTPDSLSLGSLLAPSARIVARGWLAGQEAAQRHAKNQVAQSLSVPVGNSGGSVFHLDLVAQGPHALVGGTTGAGKSEFLQTWVLSLAVRYSPREVNFLLIDYKGGAAFRECMELPHTVGTVSDLSPGLAKRALISLRAELKHRENLLQTHRAKDITQMPVAQRPPRLVLVIDEFATLINENPEFMAGVVDIAARGRSLGLHLILATQRPAGAINDNIRANTDLRIALRTADEQDSLDVVGSKIAAHFPKRLPGRALAVSGTGTKTLFQAAYAGETNETATDPITIRRYSLSEDYPWQVNGRGRRGARSNRKAQSPALRTLDAVTSAAALLQLPAPRRPYLPELAESYRLTQLLSEQNTPCGYPLGKIDLPAKQSQPILTYTPERDGNLAVYGGPGTGKTTTLRTLVAASLLTEPETAAHFYILENAGGTLRLLTGLAHVGRVAQIDDTEAFAEILLLLERELIRRAESRIQQNVTRPAPPRLILLVDGMARLREKYEYTAFWPRLLHLLTEGRRDGIHLVYSAYRPGEVPAALVNLTGEKIVHVLSVEDDYLSLGMPKAELGPDAPRGRCLVRNGSAQIAILDGAGYSRLAQLSAVTEAHSRARKPFSTKVDSAKIPAEVDGKPVLGTDLIDGSPVAITPGGVFVVSGPPGSGKSTCEQTLLRNLRRSGQTWLCVKLAAFERGAAHALPGDGWDVTAYGETHVLKRSRQLSEALLAAERKQQPETKTQALHRRLLICLEYEAGFLGADAELARTVALALQRGHLVLALARGEVPLPTGEVGKTLREAGRQAGFARLHLGAAAQENICPPGRGTLLTQGRELPVQVAAYPQAK
ncbi:FtsK/SpoIIIE domain-containing protein [Dermabacteraceae bacterium P13128]